MWPLLGVIVVTNLLGCTAIVYCVELRLTYQTLLVWRPLFCSGWGRPGAAIFRIGAAKNKLVAVMSRLIPQ